MATPSGNIVIYGHRMRDRSMFAQLDKFENKSFWEENPSIYFDTLTALHTYKIMSVFVTVATEGQGFPYHNYVALQDQDTFNTLSTCEYSNPNGRLVVVAKQIT